MTVNTGRTASKYVTFSVDDSSASLRQIAVNSISALGATYSTMDLTAWQDNATGILNNMASYGFTISGPFDTTASTGTHTVLSGIVGLNVPLSVNVSIGMRQTYQSGEPTWGVTSTTAAGFLCTSYQVDLTTMTYTAAFDLFPASTAPAWTTTPYT